MSLDNPPGSLTAGERDRWRRTETLFGLPHNDAEAAMYGFLARHLLSASMAVFEDLVKRSNGRASAACRMLLAEVAERLADPTPPATGFAIAYFPPGLTERIREAVHYPEGDRRDR